MALIIFFLCSRPSSVESSTVQPTLGHKKKEDDDKNRGAYFSVNNVSNSVVVQVQINAKLSDQIVIPELDVQKLIAELGGVGNNSSRCPSDAKSSLLMSILCPGVKRQEFNLIHRINRLLPAIIANLTSDDPDDPSAIKKTTLTPDELLGQPTLSILNGTSIKLTQLSSHYSILNVTTSFPVSDTTVNWMTIVQDLLKTNFGFSSTTNATSQEPSGDPSVTSAMTTLSTDLLTETATPSTLPVVTFIPHFWKGNVKDSIAAMGRPAGPANINSIASSMKSVWRTPRPQRRPWRGLPFSRSPQKLDEGN